MFLNPVLSVAVLIKKVVQMWLNSCLLSLTLFCDASMLGTCFVMQYLHVIMHFIVLQQPRRGGESWLLYFHCVLQRFLSCG